MGTYLHILEVDEGKRRRNEKRRERKWNRVLKNISLRKGRYMNRDKKCDRSRRERSETERKKS